MGHEGRILILVKHAQPVLDPCVPPREWQLSAEGEEQSRQLAERLTTFLPFALVCSPEPKAARTAEIVSSAVNVPYRVVEGLEEFDRPPMPIASREEHERINRALFDTRSVPVLGTESADAALARFEMAIQRTLASTLPIDNLIVIAHGTVISLFTERHTGRNAFEVWRSLQCGDYLTIPTDNDERPTTND